MTRIKPDEAILDSSVDTYLNYDTLVAQLTLSGSIANGNSHQFSVSLPYNRDKTRADVYARNLNTNKKMLVSGGPRQNPYQFTSSETAAQVVTYNNNQIIYDITVFNGTGSTINLINQVFEITAVLYNVPYV